ncbi:MAG: hypothetical protein H0W18_06365 [Acidobacteria bacterium]|nr:hypothetical protein [Acidobacteriota bacterium]
MLPISVRVVAAGEDVVHSGLRKADASSAQTSAPNRVSTPHALHAAMIERGVSGCLAISEG